MAEGLVLDIAQEALYTILLISAPVLGLTLLVGLMVSIFQATTQIQEPTLTFIPKILAALFSLIVFGPWMLGIIVDFTIRLFGGINSFVF
ncbi:MAG TPA: flagellar biosynthesis protein FliQ [Bacillota bacterium]|jgi:flagellar biosynthetic protein FliQ|nr:flagellar biosynthesis protein FliQ [Bacillota bacterium]HQD42442.1 flagellar biosynthesis protein FliQ [Bacillota bacterium]